MNAAPQNMPCISVAMSNESGWLHATASLNMPRIMVTLAARVESQRLVERRCPEEHAGHIGDVARLPLLVESHLVELRRARACPTHRSCSTSRISPYFSIATRLPSSSLQSNSTAPFSVPLSSWASSSQRADSASTQAGPILAIRSAAGASGQGIAAGIARVTMESYPDFILGESSNPRKAQLPNRPAQTLGRGVFFGPRPGPVHLGRPAARPSSLAHCEAAAQRPLGDSRCDIQAKSYAR